MSLSIEHGNLFQANAISVDEQSHLTYKLILLDLPHYIALHYITSLHFLIFTSFFFLPSNIVEQCRLIVADNGYADIVEVIRGKMEDITLPVDYVDIIISEWMVRYR